MLITRTSMFSGKENTLDLDVTNGGMLLQNAFPHLSADEREFIKTGVTPDEWEKMFGGME